MTVLLVAPLAVDVVGLDGHGARPAAAGRRSSVCQVRAEMRGRIPRGAISSCIERRRQPGTLRTWQNRCLRLLQRRQRLAVERIGREVRPAVVGDLHHRQPVDLRHPERVDRSGDGEIQPRAAAHDGAVAELVGKAQRAAAGCSCRWDGRPRRTAARRTRCRCALTLRSYRDAEIQRQIATRSASRPAASLPNCGRTSWVA